jgi:predicted ribosome quality control (RQC) complex YloA/Tae2 family protein
MALDGLVVHAIVQELQMCVGGRISKIHIPSANDILLQIRAQSSNLRLLLSANPTYPRVHFTQQTFANPTDAPMFCMLLRKYCEGGIIESVEQLDLERIIRLHIRHRDELGDVSFKTIHIEIMGRHSNIILLDLEKGLILDGIHHVTPAISTHRIVMPGSAYVAPPDQGKHDPLKVTKEAFKELFWDRPLEEPAEQRIVQLFSGVSPLVAKEIIYRSQTVQEVERIWNAFSELMTRIRNQQYSPVIVTNKDSGKSYFSVVDLTHLTGDSQRFETVSECLEAFYGDKAERDTVKQRMSDLLRFLQNEKNKNIKKLDKLAETLDEAKDADKWRVLGELLTSSMHLFKKGDSKVEAINYYDEDQKTVTVTLDPLLTPSENAQRYYKKYSKSKNSLMIVEEQIDNTHTEITYLESLLQQIAHASLADIAEIREELIEQGYIRDRSKKKGKKKKVEKPNVSCFTSSEGIPIYVGKNNTQNDFLTNRLAQSSDTWLHTKDIPGSHVVIRSTAFGEQTLLEAAQLSAYFSQAKQSSQVPVDYTYIRHVHKPNGAKPGFVIYDHQKTLFVTPDEQSIKQMQTTATTKR